MLPKNDETCDEISIISMSSCSIFAQFVAQNCRTKNIEKQVRNEMEKSGLLLWRLACACCKWCPANRGENHMFLHHVSFWNPVIILNWIPLKWHKVWQPHWSWPWFRVWNQVSDIGLNFQRGRGLFWKHTDAYSVCPTPLTSNRVPIRTCHFNV